LLSTVIWDDVRTFDGRPWRGVVDVVSGGFPYQDISLAGAGAGITGERSGLWKEFSRIIGEVGPRYVLVENSPALTSRGLGTVLGDLAALGYHARWGVLGAHHAGAPHKRDRIWIVANAHGAQRQGMQRTIGIGEEHADVSRPGWWKTEPQLGRVVDELANRVDRLRCIGNGQVSSVVRLAWETLTNTDLK
jgi:DNA (cytosine-5)-methyltransferase 1